MTASVVVVGSANLDIILNVARRPVAGETLLGSSLKEVPGGKGVNQALSAARLVSTVFVGAVGRDSAGQLIEHALAGAGVNIDHVMRGEVPTGRAYIQLTPDGENSIIVMPLANYEVTPEIAVAALERAQPNLVLAQLEVPEEVTFAAAQWCRERNARFVFNPSPARSIAGAAVVNADPIIVNHVEAQMILGIESEDHAALARELARQFTSVVLTAGPNGAFIADADEVRHILGEQVVAVDTTGAGDAFAGTLAGHLALGARLVDAAVRANLEAARVIQLPREER